ncbi:sugar transporter-domain-containing protein [Biscogniauxia marginata]|nr:sugar transporter-domain-containing protein [Biscogniauxia marginata]
MAEKVEPVSAPTQTYNHDHDQDHDLSMEKGRHGPVPHIDINRNPNAKISNPLAGIPRDQLFANVDSFVNQHGLGEYRSVLRKGALISQDPACFEDIQGEEALDEAEIYALKREITHKWRVPKILYLTIITCSIGAAVQGWDQEGSNGANLTFPQQFGIGGESDYDVYLVGLINSAPYIGSALIGCWCSDPLNNIFGRRGTIFISAIFCLLTPIGGAVTQNWQQLLITRLLLGVGMGIKASTVPIFAAENSPAAIRGALVMTWQLWTAFGIWLGTCANLAVGGVGTIAWRLQVGSAFIPAIPLTILIFFCPESPRWFIKKHRYRDAMKSLLRLRNNPIQAARDLYSIHAQVEIEAEAIGDSTYLKRFVELFTIPRIRRATLASFVVMIAQQMCGINIIAFYSSTVFREAGASDFGALLASFGFGLVNFIFAWPAIWTIDTFGRRSLLLFTFPNMAWSLLAAGLCTLIPSSSSAHVGLVALFIYIFAAFYSPGEGPVPFTYSAEVFPLSHREVGMSWAVATCLFWAAVLSITFPKILASLGVLGAFCLYAGFNVVALVMLFLWLPETKQRTLEELDYVFGVPTGVFVKYNCFKALPWWFRRYILFQRHATLEPLYHFDSQPAVVSSDGMRDGSSGEGKAVANTTENAGTK